MSGLQKAAPLNSAGFLRPVNPYFVQFIFHAFAENALQQPEVLNSSLLQCFVVSFIAIIAWNNRLGDCYCRRESLVCRLSSLQLLHLQWENCWCYKSDTNFANDLSLSLFLSFLLPLHTLDAFHPATHHHRKLHFHFCQHLHLIRLEFCQSLSLNIFQQGFVQPCQACSVVSAIHPYSYTQSFEWCLVCAPGEPLHRSCPHYFLLRLSRLALHIFSII